MEEGNKTREHLSSRVLIMFGTIISEVLLL